MTEAAPIDDVRRFKELWKELVFARLLVPCAAVAIFWLPVAAAGPAPSEALMLLLVGPIAILYLLGPVAPSLAAKRGWIVLPAVLSAMLVGCLATYAGLRIIPAEEIRDHPTVIKAYAGVYSAVVGLVEGLLERSLSTTYCGLIGGGLCGGVVGWALGWADSLGPLDFASGWGLLAGIIALPTVHLGIGLSLALGRWIRDLPKRGVDPGADEG